MKLSNEFFLSLFGQLSRENYGQWRGDKQTKINKFQRMNWKLLNYILIPAWIYVL